LSEKDIFFGERKYNTPTPTSESELSLVRSKASAKLMPYTWSEQFDQTGLDCFDLEYQFRKG